MVTVFQAYKEFKKIYFFYHFNPKSALSAYDVLVLIIAKIKFFIILFNRIPRLKGFDTPAPSTADSSLPNPFADRPSTARQHAQAKSQLEAAINDLDKISNMPEGIEESVWQRLCAYRREKIENDLLVKLPSISLQSHIWNSHSQVYILKEKIKRIPIINGNIYAN